MTFQEVMAPRTAGTGCTWLGGRGLSGSGPTAGTAQALARYGEPEITVVSAGGEREAIGPLPLAALRLDDEALAATSRFGFDRVADIVPLPRGPLARRMGLAAVQRLDQAPGHVAEPISGLVPFDAPTVELRLLEPIGGPEQIAMVAADQVSMLVERLRVDGVRQILTCGLAKSRQPHQPAHVAVIEDANCPWIL